MSLSVEQLQAYIQEQQAQYVTLSKPGYEVYFYSRMDENAAIVPYLTKWNPDQPNPNVGGIPVMDAPLDSGEGPKRLLGTTPTLALDSDVRDDGIPIVTSVQVHNVVGQVSGSSAEIQLVEPKGVDFFKQTIGDKSLHPGYPDFDYSYGMPSHRIGTMDTVVIRLKNATQTDTKREVVFRGVITKIARSKSPTDGSHITISLADFSEFLRQISAISLGIFSTMSFSLTGRGLCYNLLLYANKLYSGNWLILGLDQSQILTTIQKGIADFLKDGGNSALTSFLTNNQDNAEGTPLTPSQTTESASQIKQGLTNAMTVPPYLHLQYSLPNERGFVNPNLDMNAANGQLAGNVLTPLQNAMQAQAPAQNTFGQASNATDPQQADNLEQQAYNQQVQADNVISSTFSNIINYLSTKGNNFVANNSPFALTPEDQESVSSYQVSLSKGFSDDITKSNSPNQDMGNTLTMNLEKYAWILSDLYLDVGLLSFEHQKIWQTMFDAASRSLREVYFDFAPKLSSDATAPWVTAQVTEIKAAGPGALPDVHPNIGILKYRLSPCFLVYKEGNQNLTSQFWQYKITDDQIVTQDLVETEEHVATAVFGFGSNFDNEAVGADIAKTLAGQTRGLFAYAQTIDPSYSARFGYRILSDHDMTIRFPILMYLTSYALLERAEMSMFYSTVTVAGDPMIQPGSLVFLENPYIDYYCTEVMHKWSLQDGYTTTMQLGYGHTHGIAPAALTGGTYVDQAEQYKQCTLKSSALDPYIPEGTIKNNVDVHCLTVALWQYMTGCASSTDALRKANSDYENSFTHKYFFNSGSQYSDPVISNGWDDSTMENRYGTKYVANYGELQWPIPAGWKQHPASDYDSIIDSAISYHGLDKFNVTRNCIKNIIWNESTWYADAFNGVAYGWFQIYKSHIPKEITVQNAVESFQDALNIACSVLKDGFRQSCNGNPENATGMNFLNAFAYYGGEGANNNGITAYMKATFGNQAQQIANNSLTPGQQPGQNLQQWPYKVYGPIGMQVDGACQSFFKMPSDQLKSQLETWDIGMKLSVKYINYLISKYGSANLQGSGVYQSIDQTNVLQKVIAAWYGNETDNNMDATKWQKVYSDIQTLYMSCQNCNSNKSLANVSNNDIDNAVQKVRLGSLNFRVPVDTPYVTSPFQPPSRPRHHGWDLVNNATYTKFPVYAAEDGVVLMAENGIPHGYGNGVVVLEHLASGDYVQTTYGDLSSWSVSPGQTVKRGDHIGDCYNYYADQETGIHVHWQINSNCSAGAPFTGVPQNPAQFVAV